MTIWQYALLLAAGLGLIFAACVAPARIFKILIRCAINAAGALAVLVVVNLIGVALPLNAVTVIAGSLLGIPGMAALTVLAAL